MYKSKNKYSAKKTEIDGIEFDSILESRFYMYFKKNNIKILEFQPKYILQDKFKYENKTIRAIKYIADFKIEYEGDIYIIDAKGMNTPVFSLKHKLWLKKYGEENILIIAKSIKHLKEQIM